MHENTQEFSPFPQIIQQALPSQTFGHLSDLFKFSCLKFPSPKKTNHPPFTHHSPTIHPSFTHHSPIIHPPFTNHSPTIPPAFTNHSPSVSPRHRGHDGLIPGGRGGPQVTGRKHVGAQTDETTGLDGDVQVVTLKLTYIICIYHI